MTNEIKKLLPDKDDYEIMKRLGIPNSTYYRYKSRIYQEDRELWNQIARESLESRALKIMRSLDYRIQVNKEICESSENARARIKASREIVEAHIMAHKLLQKGPNYLLI